MCISSLVISSILASANCSGLLKENEGNSTEKITCVYRFPSRKAELERDKPLKKNKKGGGLTFLNLFTIDFKFFLHLDSGNLNNYLIL